MKREPETKGEDGFALITVLWAVLILATIAASIMATGRTESRLSRTHLDMAELDAVRRATIALFSGLDADALARRGTANNNPITVRALAWIIAGHERHHVAILRERYLA